MLPGIKQAITGNYTKDIRNYIDGHRYSDEAAKLHWGKKVKDAAVKATLNWLPPVMKLELLQSSDELLPSLEVVDSWVKDITTEYNHFSYEKKEHVGCNQEPKLPRSYRSWPERSGMLDLVWKFNQAPEFLQKKEESYCPFLEMIQRSSPCQRSAFF